VGKEKAKFFGQFYHINNLSKLHSKVNASPFLAPNFAQHAFFQAYSVNGATIFHSPLKRSNFAKFCLLISFLWS